MKNKKIPAAIGFIRFEISYQPIPGGGFLKCIIHYNADQKESGSSPIQAALAGTYAEKNITIKHQEDDYYVADWEYFFELISVEDALLDLKTILNRYEKWPKSEVKKFLQETSPFR